MIGIIDYGVGNLRSVQKAIQAVGHEAEVVATPEAVAKADKVILPGVGAFEDAMKQLQSRDLEEPVLEVAKSGRWLMGICLGMQMLFNRSFEDGEHQGLGLIDGDVVHFELDDPSLKVPHMGWNSMLWERDDLKLTKGLDQGDHVYFVHSYYGVPQDGATAIEADYGIRFCAAVEKGNVLGTQFHPEKSQRVGLQMLKNFAEL